MEKKYDEAGRIGVEVPSISDVLGKQHPEKKFRAGGVTATIWLNHKKEDEGKQSTFRTISIERSYMDKDNNWQSTNTLRVNDLPKANLVVQKAYEYILLKEEEDKVKK